MDEKELARQLGREGFARTFVWEDGPNAFYPAHTHTGETAHVILRGEMTLTMDGVAKTYRQGERCDVPAGAVHTAKMGAGGCRYLVGEK
jgi:quercetin dioxygenase-like cupin family protein